MTQKAPSDEAPADLLSKLVEAIRADEVAGLSNVETLISEYPHDPRLQFLRGSLLAGLRRYDEAHDAMAKSIEIAPGYAVARFQLGFLDLTSGDAPSAQLTWAPLLNRPEDDALRLFVEGLEHLIRDEFEQCIAVSTRGIACNTENPVISGDMTLIIQKAREHLAAPQPADESVSATHFLLRQYTSPTKH
jgi:hypothetical protein